MKLVQTRSCDGACCKESPRWPNEKGSDCIYHDGSGKLTTRCSLQRGDISVPTKESPAWPGRSAEDVYQETCVNWPQNSKIDRPTGGCCWQRVEG